MTLKLCLSGNEPRQQYLFNELSRVVDVRANVPFDDIDPVTKYAAAALSFAWPRSEWWENYHMHALVQQRRSRVLMRGLAPHLADSDALLMWGSWFQPTFPGRALPYFNYIDQSRSLENLPGERKGHFTRRKLSHALQAETYAASSGVFTMSEWARRQTLESHSLPEDKVITVGWGPCSVDLSAEDPPAQREPIVLHVSNDFHRKGADYLIATAARVREAVPGARFVVIGRDSSGTTLPPTGDVEFLGPIYDKPALAQWFRRATVFFLPHRFDRSPHVLTEAMSAGLPLVASAQGGAVEVIQGRENGYLCESGDIERYADVLIWLLRDAEHARRLGANGLAIMRSYYNWSAIARRMIAHIEQTLSGKQRSAAA